MFYLRFCIPYKTGESNIWRNSAKHILEDCEYHMHAYIYLCKNIIGGLNIGNFIQKLPKFTPRQHFILYGIQIYVYYGYG